MEKKDQYHNSEEGYNTLRLEELAEKGAQGLLNSEEQKEYFALLKAQNTADDDTVDVKPADIALLQSEKVAASDEQSAQADALKAKLEDGIEAYSQYLQHAPEEFKKLWEKSSEEDKEIYKKHVEFTVDGPNILGKSGKKYELAKDNLTVGDKDINKGKIDKHEGVTYFEWDALKEYTNKNNIDLPTEIDYLNMLRVMPAGDTIYQSGVGGRQLFCILGGDLSGSLTDGSYNDNFYGSLWSGSPHVNTKAHSLYSNERKGELRIFHRAYQFPARSFRTPR